MASVHRFSRRPSPLYYYDALFNKKKVAEEKLNHSIPTTVLPYTEIRKRDCHFLIILIHTSYSIIYKY